ncbi:ATP-dependent (S)-NAD(P)H-hydrate dehydratase [Eupeodes corollae]|uniref:ATP-dependent (S)-NAD(P)H-hydrate dehydratase n=1 Tax=Eupeodes corollae TaxID=290404 RepID=UPI00248F846B|nr:ATP-dependent (S)-NAD(P)H-hydrate dehydratase [Eupeodes corollae]
MIKSALRWGQIEQILKYSSNQSIISQIKPRNKSSNMTQLVEASVDTNKLLRLARLVVPSLGNGKHKGQAGRIGVIGGSLEYTGAPYFAAISALKVGADLVHVFCQREAASVIKSYSPELIVHPLLDLEDAVSQIEPWLERLHVLVIGPGLGRERNIFETVSQIIESCRAVSKPLIIDADGLHLISGNRDLIKDYNGVILTPNAREFEVLFGDSPDTIEENMKSLGNGITVMRKGARDKIYITNTVEIYQLGTGGSGRRCGGQGDLLSGSLATFYHWALESNQTNPTFISTFASSFLTKQCNSYAFKKFGRSMVTGDMINEIHNVFEDFFE